ncbi:hypothetical protein ABE10_10620 [Bacillus toyonensis]|nr:hypothetical protein [Bacillus toyonensis]
MHLAPGNQGIGRNRLPGGQGVAGSNPVSPTASLGEPQKHAELRGFFHAREPMRSAPVHLTADHAPLRGLPQLRAQRLLPTLLNFRDDLGDAARPEMRVRV